MRPTRRMARGAAVMALLLPLAPPQALAGQEGPSVPENATALSAGRTFKRAAVGAALGLWAGFGAGAMACEIHDCRPADRSNVRATASLLGGVAGSATAVWLADADHGSFGRLLATSLVGGAVASGVAIGSVLLLEDRGPLAVQGATWTLSFSVTQAAVMALLR